MKEEPKLMTLQEASKIIKEGDIFRPEELPQPSDFDWGDFKVVKGDDCDDGLYFESNDKRIQLNTKHFELKGEIIPADPKVLSAEEWFKTIQPYPDEQDFGNCLLDAFYQGDQNGQLKDREKTLPLIRAVEKIITYSGLGAPDLSKLRQIFNNTDLSYPE